MILLSSILFLLLIISGPILLFFGLPGTFAVALLTLLFSWIHDFKVISSEIIILLFVLSAIAEAAEFGTSVYISKRYGSSKAAIIGSLVGGITGTFLLTTFLPPFGMFLGAFGGTFIGAFCVDWYLSKDWRKSNKSGLGAVLGRALGLMFKGGLCMGMIFFDYAKTIAWLVQYFKNN